MSLIAAALRELIAAGLSGEDLVSAVARIEAESHSAVKTARQERNARYYASKASEKRLNKTNSDVQDVSDAAAEPSFPLERKVSPCTPSKETNPLPSTPSASPQVLSGRERDFADVWKAYPRKIGKDAAFRAFSKAMDREPGLTAPAVIAAIKRYERFKPPDIDFCHLATWFNGGRWNDEWAERNSGNSQRQHRPPGGHDNLLTAMDELLGAGRRRDERPADHASVDDAYRDPAGVYRLTN